MKKLLLLSLISVSLFSCDNDDEDVQDLEKPVFSKVMLNTQDVTSSTSPAEITLHEGMSHSLSFKITTTDNEELSQLQVEVHEALDGHDHARLAGEGTDTLTFGPEIYTLTGKSTETTVGISVPETVVHGEYHLECVLLDKAGNRTEKVIEFHLEEEEHDDH